MSIIAETAACDIFVTIDRNLPRERRITALPFAIVVLRAKSNRYGDTNPLMPEVLRRLAEFQPGRVYVCGEPG